MIERAPGLPAGLVHGFSDRLGGVSEGRYATLNLGRRWGDDPAAVAENYRRVAAAGGFRGETLRTVRQVHGDVVLRARDLVEGSEADGLWVHRDDGPLVAGVLTADCVPLLLADRAGTVAAAVHSGWKGTVADIAGAAVRVLAEQVPVHTLVAAIGPCIEVGAFEVGEVKGGKHRGSLSLAGKAAKVCAMLAQPMPARWLRPSLCWACMLASQAWRVIWLRWTMRCDPWNSSMRAKAVWSSCAFSEA